MKSWVVDASFILRSLLSPNSQTSDFLRKIFRQEKKGRVKIYSTSSLPLEVANGLRFTLNDSEIGRKIFADFSRLPLEYFDLKPNQIKEILNLAYRVEATVYDTSYHFLARLLGGELLTCDREYFEKAQSLGSINFVK